MSKNNINDLIETLKEQGQDFEFYPTTEEIIDKMVSNILKCYDEERLYHYNFNILDIGAGNASVLSKIEEKFNLKNPNASLNKYAIEKSEILIEQMPRDITVIGTDFYETSLIEKSYFQVVFCNPPFKEYEAFASRIIKEINANRIYLVLPKRWRSNENIKKAIYSRKDTLKEQKSLGFFSFVNAKRKARAKVEIVEFSFKKENFNSENDFLAKSLKEYFNIDLDTLQGKLEKEEELQRTLQEKIREIENKDLINELVRLYNEEFKNFNEALASFNNIPKSILASLNIDKSAIVEAIRGELKSIKFVFWREIFSKIDSINERLIPKYRLDLARKFADLNIDFTYSNIKSACIYAIKNANYYVDLGVLDLFDDFTEGGALEYKSNKKFIFSHKWRFQDDKFKAKKLDYRVVYNKLSYNNTRDFMDKLFTIAKTLGFKPEYNFNLINHYNYTNENENYYSTNTSSKYVSQTDDTFYFINHKGEQEIFFTFRAFKNGNLHLKFNKEFVQCFNLAVGRLRKWINNKAEAKENFPECKEEIIDKAFLLVDEMQIKKNDIKLLN